jgi:hypothetical protein
VKPTLFSLLLTALAAVGCVNLPAGEGKTSVQVDAEVKVADEGPPEPVQPDEINEDNAGLKVKLLLEEIRRDEADRNQ